jgi:hypothetical protein
VHFHWDVVDRVFEAGVDEDARLPEARGRSPDALAVIHAKARLRLLPGCPWGGVLEREDAQAMRA